MRWIIWYLKSCFCNHTWQTSETVAQPIAVIQIGIDERCNVKVSERCTKCGWHRSYWKYGHYAAVISRTIQQS